MNKEESVCFMSNRLNKWTIRHIAIKNNQTLALKGPNDLPSTNKLESDCTILINHLYTLVHLGCAFSSNINRLLKSPVNSKIKTQKVNLLSKWLYP